MTALPEDDHAEPPSTAYRLSWGPPPAAGNGLGEHILELQQELQADLERNLREPFRQLAEDGRNLIRTIALRLKVRQQRLLAMARELDEAVATETDVADLTESVVAHFESFARVVKDLALSRAKSGLRLGWSPSALVDAIERALAQLPEALAVEIPEAVFAPDPKDGLLRAFSRRRAAVVAALARRSRGEEPTRVVPLRSFVGWHLRRSIQDGLEGVTALVVQAEADLQSRARSVYELAAHDIEQVIADPVDLERRLQGLGERLQVETEEAMDELLRYETDIASRAGSMLVSGLEAAKGELSRIGTFRLPASQRDASANEAGFRRFVDHLDERFAELRQALREGFIAFGLRVELSMFRVKARLRIDSAIDEIEGVTERLVKQVVRVRGGLDVVVESLGGSPSQPTSELERRPERSSDLPLPDRETKGDKEIDKVFHDFARIIENARSASSSGQDFLRSSAALEELLQSLVVESKGLSNFYDVPVRRLPRAEYVLPGPPARLEVAFPQLVAAFVEKDLAQVLLGTFTERAVGFRGMGAAFDEAEQVAQLGSREYDSEVGDAIDGFDWASRGRSSALLSTCQRARDRMLVVERETQEWSQAMVVELREVLRRQLDRLEARFSDDELEEVVAEQVRLQFKAERGQRAGLRGFMRRAAQASGLTRVQAAVGDGRVARAFRALGFSRTRVTPDFAARLAPVRAPSEVPLYYRRLFAPQGTWMVDALKESGAELERILGAAPRGRLRTLAIVGQSVAGRRAMVAHLTRHETFRRSHKVVFSRPVSVEDVRRSLGVLNPEQPLVLGGLHWLVSAEPGGFDAVRCLCEMILADGGRTPVVLDAQPIVWAWAAGVAPLEEVFVEQLEIPTMGPAELEEALLTRHGLSGMEVGFGEESSDANRSRFFRDLARASDGVLAQALSYWLGSIEQVDTSGGDGRVRIGPVPPGPHDALRALPDDLLHLGYLVLRQGWMTPSVLAGLLGIRLPMAEASLARMVGLGLVERTPADVFVFRRHLASAALRVLGEREWI